MNAALSTTMMATDLADYHVRKGASFRQAHEAVGSVIREAETRGCDLNDLDGAAFSKASNLFGEDASRSLDPVTSVGNRNIPGGTGPESVRGQLEQARRILTR
jgi:argininosuccinate lyase